jgi:hypothetical protein
MVTVQVAAQVSHQMSASVYSTEIRRQMIGSVMCLTSGVTPFS